jgi:hypothetical protein
MSAVALDLGTRSAPMSPAGALFALLLLGMGAFIAGIGLGWVPCDPESLHAPRWVVVVCGAVFACGGVGVLATALGFGRALAPAIAALVLVGLALVCHWIAFAAGEREFTATRFVSGLDAERYAVDERTGRTAFAFAAVSFDMLLVLVAARARRARWRAPWRPLSRPAGE